MSTMYTTIDIDFENLKRKPSKAVIMRSLAEYIKHGYRSFNVIWGENVINLDYHPNHKNWYGQGWIKEIGGDDLAKELTAIQRDAEKFIKDHFSFIHIK